MTKRRSVQKPLAIFLTWATVFTQLNAQGPSQLVEKPQGPVVIRWYQSPELPPIQMENTERLHTLIRGGKLYLTMQDAIAVAELGNGNRPLDIISYQKDGRTFLLLANSRRGVMKISTDNVEKQEGITQKIDSTAGLSYETIDGLKGMRQPGFARARRLQLAASQAAGAVA